MKSIYKTITERHIKHVLNLRASNNAQIVCTVNFFTSVQNK